MGLVRLKGFLLPVVAIAVVATAITTTNYARRSAVAADVVVTEPELHSAAIPQGKESSSDEGPSNVQVVLFALRSEGFEPTEMRLKAGEYLFVVRNRTGLDEVKIRLVGENDHPLLVSKVGSRREALKRRLNLKPGTYRLTETDHPDWICTIIVEQ